MSLLDERAGRRRRRGSRVASGSSQTLVLGLERATHELLGGGRVDALELRHAAGGPPEPCRAARRRARERRRPPRGTRTTATLVASRSVAGAPAAARIDARTGFVPSDAAAAARDRPSHIRRLDGDRRDEQHDRPRRSPGRRARRAATARSSSPSRSRACRPGWRRSPRREGSRGAASASRPRAGEARGRRASHASAQRIPRPPAFVTHRDATPARQRLRREERGDVDQLAERVGADDARVAEEGVDRGVGAGQGCRVRPGCRLPDAERPLFIARIGFLRDSRRAIRANFARVPERLDVEERRGSSRRRPPTTRAGRSTRRRPCCRSRRTPRGRARGSRRARGAPGRARRSGTRSRCARAGTSAARTSR